MKLAVILIPLSLGLFSCGHAQNNSQNDASGGSKVDSLADPNVVNYLGVNGPFQVGDYYFHLRWSSHPTDNYYKHEYIPQQYFQLDQYIQMIMLEVATGDINPKKALESKIQEIESRKAGDPYANYTRRKDPKTGDDMLEFTLSQNNETDNGIAEWNVYRYVPYTSPSGQKGVELFGYSRRGYGMKIYPFKGEIERDHEKFINNFLAVPVPAVKLK